VSQAARKRRRKEQRKELRRRVYLARTYTMTPEERDAQRRCWVYGQTKMSNANVTREMVDKVVDKWMAEEAAERGTR
jgi:hypothetical protein